MSIFGGISKALFGDGGAGTIQAGARKADRQLTEGYNLGRESQVGASEVFDPYVQGGQQYQQLYDDFMGLNGPEAQAAAQQIMEQNPAFQSQLVGQLRGSDRGLNAMGAGPGKEALASARIYADNAMNFADRYRQGGTQGLQAAGQKSGALTNLGSYDYGYGATRAGNTINTSNALAQAQQAPVNNLIGLAGAGLGAVGSYYGAKG